MPPKTHSKQVEDVDDQCPPGVAILFSSVSALFHRVVRDDWNHRAFGRKMTTKLGRVPVI